MNLNPARGARYCLAPANRQKPPHNLSARSVDQEVAVQAHIQKVQ